jgi:FtsP/CotA-like multicopper oxidase with cupredoxin domain
MSDQNDDAGGSVAARSVSRRGVLLATAGGAGALAGMSAAPVAAGAEGGTAAGAGQLREYWVQADSWWHNAVPTGYDPMMDTRYSAEQTSFWAVGYRAYTPGWGGPLPGDEWIGPNTGLPGPTIRARAGDRVRIHFRNNDSHYRLPHSVHVHGLRYRPSSDGSFIAAYPETPGAAVPYGHSYTYEYSAAPSSVGTWPYHDHSMAQALRPGGAPVAEVGSQLGLLGVVAVTDALTPSVDVEHVLVFHDVYPNEVPPLTQHFNLFNGRAFLDNTPTFTASVGQRVRWRIIALGREFHVFHLHGHRWSDGVRQVDAQTLGPSTSLTVEYTEAEPGDWLYHCHIVDHMMGGMVGRYQVT